MSKRIDRYRALAHLIGVIASAIASALVAVGAGGDPVLGAGVGAVINSGVAVLTA